MNRQEIDDIVSQIEEEHSLFAKKAYLDALATPEKIIGRKKQAKELVRYLLGYKQGYVVPFVSIYGRSGSGKSVVTKFVCDNLEDIAHSFVNLRQAKTVFGAANLILASLGKSNLKSAQGINLAVEKIERSIGSLLDEIKKKLFVLVLDEFDVLFYDKRGKPSDFLYKLVVLEENLRKKDKLLCIIGISNNVLSEYELDDRVRSRIGNSEIFFEPYSKSDVFEILNDRAKKAFSKSIPSDILQYCAELGSEEHGDARRSLDLLRVSAELASLAGQDMTRSHVDKALSELQKDRASNVLSAASYHLKVVCGALAYNTLTTGDMWHSTSELYKTYCILVKKETKPLGYRRVGELLTELENTGLCISQTSSKGRHGYGTQYKLTISPEIVGSAIDSKWWNDIVAQKEKNDNLQKVSEELGRMQKKDYTPSEWVRKSFFEGKL